MTKARFLALFVCSFMVVGASAQDDIDATLEAPPSDFAEPPAPPAPPAPKAAREGKAKAKKKTKAQKKAKGKKKKHP
jgi:hypothetical protein